MGCRVPRPANCLDRYTERNASIAVSLLEPMECPVLTVLTLVLSTSKPLGIGLTPGVSAGQMVQVQTPVTLQNYSPGMSSTSRGEMVEALSVGSNAPPHDAAPNIESPTAEEGQMLQAEPVLCHC